MVTDSKLWGKGRRNFRNKKLGLGRYKNWGLVKSMTSTPLDRNEDNIAGTIRGINNESLGGKGSGGEISKLQNLEISKI